MGKTLKDVINANEEISKDQVWFFTFDKVFAPDKESLTKKLRSLFTIVEAQYDNKILDHCSRSDANVIKNKGVLSKILVALSSKLAYDFGFPETWPRFFHSTALDATLHEITGKGHLKQTIKTSNRINTEKVFNRVNKIIVQTYMEKAQKERLKLFFTFQTTDATEVLDKLDGNINAEDIYLDDSRLPEKLDLRSDYPSRKPDDEDEKKRQVVEEHVNTYEYVKHYPFSRNRIIFGAPGTGKSFLADRNADYLLFIKRKNHKANAEENIPNSSWKLNEPRLSAKSWCIERVTFHPEYNYYDFVGSYKPVMEGKNIKYDFVPGPFTRMLVKALKDEKHPYLLLIEEINRARVAAVFGDIFQLLDRDSKGESEYPISISEDLQKYLKENLSNSELVNKGLYLPKNLYIWATMNSADQGVYPLDTAFKRRWSMEYIPYDPNKKKTASDKWNQIRIRINKLLLEKGHVNEDKLMGYYFLKEEERADDKLKDALQNKVLMYLFDDAAKHCRKEIFKIEGKDVITFSALQNKMRAAMKQRIDPNSNLGVFSEALQHPAAGNNG